MGPKPSFRDLMDEVRAGDEDAARRLVELYAPEIRREVRLHLRHSDARRVVDSDDLCQSVFGVLFAQITNGHYDVKEPRELVALLITIARNRMIDLARRRAIAQRIPPEQIGVPLVNRYGVSTSEPASSPSQHWANQELLHEFRRRLTPDELAVAARRSEGWEWNAIAKEFGASPEALRKRLERGLRRVAGELDIDDL